MHDRSKYDGDIIIKQLANEFDSDEFDCIGENTEKYISFSIPIDVEIKDENGKPVKREKKNKKGEKIEVDLV